MKGAERSTLCSGSFVIGLDYVGKLRDRKKIIANVRSIKYGWTKNNEFKYWLYAVHLNDESGKILVKTFVASRVLSIFDIETGEIIYNGTDGLNHIVESLGGVPPDTWPSEKIRTKEIDIYFEDGYVRGWFFGVSTAFRDALDIKYESCAIDDGNGSKTFSGWTVGVPPEYSFAPGDVFYHPYEREKKPWGDQIKNLIYSVKVKSLKAAHDELIVDLVEYGNGIAVKNSEIILSQNEFGKLLMFGPKSLHENHSGLNEPRTLPAMM